MIVKICEIAQFTRATPGSSLVIYTLFFQAQLLHYLVKATQTAEIGAEALQANILDACHTLKTSPEWPKG